MGRGERGKDEEGQKIEGGGEKRSRRRKEGDRGEEYDEVVSLKRSRRRGRKRRKIGKERERREVEGEKKRNKGRGRAEERGGGGERWGSEMYPVWGRSLSHDGLNDLPLQRKVRVQARTCWGSVAGLRDQGRQLGPPRGPARGGSQDAG